jgi:hypothetical protein
MGRLPFSFGRARLLLSTYERGSSFDKLRMIRFRMGEVALATTRRAARKVIRFHLGKLLYVLDVGHSALKTQQHALSST